jgi:dihydrofolate reductase
MGRKLILYIAMSLDGYIAGKNDDLGFLSAVALEGEDYGYNDFIKTIDAIIIGRKAFDKVISMGFEYPHQDKDVYIISRHPRPAIGNFKYYTDNLKELVLKLKSEQGKNIFCDGGAEITNELLSENLIDEFVISIIPVILGEGTPLFKKGRTELKLRLINSKQFEKGLVQLHYTLSGKPETF